MPPLIPCVLNLIFQIDPFALKYVSSERAIGLLFQYFNFGFRAFDKLLKLAEEQGHFLQGVASEALGHLAHGEHAARILRLLKQALSQVSPYSDQVESILRGLRWLNLPESWQLIRGFIQDSAQHSYYQSKAIALLKHHDSPANRQLLLDLLQYANDDLVVHAAYNTAQWLWGN